MQAFRMISEITKRNHGGSLSYELMTQWGTKVSFKFPKILSNVLLRRNLLGTEILSSQAAVVSRVPAQKISLPSQELARETRGFRKIEGMA